jgi:hypothetical protein
MTDNKSVQAIYAVLATAPNGNESLLAIKHPQTGESITLVTTISKNVPGLYGVALDAKQQSGEKFRVVRADSIVDITEEAKLMYENQYSL